MCVCVCVCVCVVCVCVCVCVCCISQTANTFGKGIHSAIFPPATVK